MSANPGKGSKPAAPMGPNDIRVFCDAAAAFFQQTTGAQAAVRTAYLMPEAEPPCGTTSRA